MTEQQTHFLFDRESKTAIFQTPKCASVTIGREFDFDVLTINRLHWAKKIVVMARHPNERMVSAFAWFMANPQGVRNYKPIHPWLLVDMPFDRFIENAIADRAKNKHFQPQTEYNRAAFDNAFGADVAICKLEQCPKRWREVTGLDWPRKRHNKHDHPKWKSVFSDKHRELMAECYAADFETLGYKP